VNGVTPAYAGANPRYSAASTTASSPMEGRERHGASVVTGLGSNLERLAEALSELSAKFRGAPA
jgi:hypothetical protein